MSEHKICNVCGIDKPISEYYFRSETGKYRCHCKKCKPLNRKEDIMNRVATQTHKVCKHCGEEKSIDQYQKAGGGKWLQPYCKPCDSDRKKKHHAENRERVVAHQKEYYESNKEVIAAKDKAKRDEHRKANPLQPRTYTRMSEDEFKRRKSESDRKYREKNEEHLKRKKQEYKKSGRAREVGNAWQRKKMNDIEFRVKKNLRGRIYVALKHKAIKSQPTMELLGCTIEYFKHHIESLFTEGMNWGNMGIEGWHIDHKIPCYRFDLTKPEEQKKCFHYSNLQPLWQLDNLKKGIKYEELQKVS